MQTPRTDSCLTQIHRLQAPWEWTNLQLAKRSIDKERIQNPLLPGNADISIKEWLLYFHCQYVEMVKSQSDNRDAMRQKKKQKQLNNSDMIILWNEFAHY